MKLTKVIEILILDKTCDFEGDTEDLEKAHQIAIEAVYRCQEFRKYKTPGVYMPLPGETPEN